MNLTDEELIKRVAEEVMGWKLHSRNNWEWWTDENDKPYAVSRDGKWNPLLNANHWMMVVERMLELGYSIVIERFKDNWIVSLFKTTYFGAKREFNKSLGHAICMAALKAVENG